VLLHHTGLVVLVRHPIAAGQEAAGTVVDSALAAALVLQKEAR